MSRAEACVVASNEAMKSRLFAGRDVMFNFGTV